MPLPNFLIIGDLKAGTTSLHSYLKQHPEIYVPPDVKELRYFSYDKENSYHVRAKSSVVRTLDEYLGYFAASGHAKSIGEASPNYLRSPGAAERIRRQIPDAKIVVSLRNPAHRLHSVHQMRLRSGLDRLPFDERLFSYDAAWIKSNFYWGDLNRYFQAFERRQIHVILFDELTSNPRKTVKDTYEFLGVDASFEPDLAVRNAGGMPKSPFLYKAFEGSRRLIKSTGVSSEFLRNMTFRLRRGLLAPVEPDQKIQRQILEICKDDIQRTQDLIKRDLSIWLREATSPPHNAGFRTIS